MTFQAKHGLGLGGELVERRECFEIAFAGFCGVLDGQTARSVAGFAVDQGQTGFTGNLFTMDRMFEIEGDFIVFVATFKAVLVADVIGFKAADQKSFVILNCGDGSRRLQAVNVAAGDCDQNQHENEAKHEVSQG